MVIKTLYLELIERNERLTVEQGKSSNKLIAEFKEDQVIESKGYKTPMEKITKIAEEYPVYGNGCKFNRDKANER